jgi:hypothetical protein
MGTRDFFPGGKAPGREADHSPPSSVEVKNAWSHTSTLPMRLHSVVLSLKKKVDNFAYTLYIYLMFKLQLI